MNYRYEWELKMRTDDGDDIYVIRHYDLPDAFLDESALVDDDGYEAPAELARYVWRRCRDVPGCAEEWYLFRSWQTGTYYVRPHKGYPLPVTSCAVTTVQRLADGRPIDWNFDGITQTVPYAWDVNQSCKDRDPCMTCTWVVDPALPARWEMPLLQPKVYGLPDDFATSLSGATPADETASYDPGCGEPPPELQTDGEYCDGRDNDGDGLIDEGFGDLDDDGIANMIDNCPLISNSNQFDMNRNHIGDACEGPPDVPTGLSVIVVDGVPTLAWTENAAGTVLGYNVYRQIHGERDYRRLEAPFPTVLAASYADTLCLDGTTYAVSAVSPYLRESALSDPVVLGEGVCPTVHAYLPALYKNAAWGQYLDCPTLFQDLVGPFVPQ
jgi:hypothetical protein